ncbi:hypothetical protein A8C56_07320 [Niabella ginsenosidivorans]|uniref:Acetyltransferase n=1 Tax=Niabella ginsenosidivorans TaxID=1176587 RepID=A0A1A9HZW9_9BACT|nr:N-acetyltransferase [Niabella ginsenosidivorans]ANH80813.1 hypothetical protein A8C56_07320 [Niabella ginsenosidivorans]
MKINDILIRVAVPQDQQYARTIVNEMEASAKARGTGIAKRSPELINQEIREGKAVIAATQSGWEDDQLVSHCGLIVSPHWRRRGVATKLKKNLFRLTRKKFPNAKIFGITTGLATMKINASLGLNPVTCAEITLGILFRENCKSCAHYNTLQSTGYKNCLCTALLFDPQHKKQKINLYDNHSIAGGSDLLLPVL